MQIEFQTDTVTAVLIAERELNPEVTLNCGQCFRWYRQPDGSFSGIALGRSLTLRRRGALLLFEGTTPEDFNLLWADYFDLRRNYDAIYSTLSEDPIISLALTYAPGMHILHQQPWEALCSFIISQNNNIPRITGIIERLCEAFGDKIEGGYTFPSAERIAKLTLDDLAPLRSGFRAKYILDAARKVAEGDVELEILHELPLEEAQKTLQKIIGVGPKVAECALLFGCGRIECFPIDVWIKRVLQSFYPEGFPEKFKPYGGIAQQVLFHYARCCPACELIRG